MSGDVVYPGLIIFDFLFFYKKKAPIQQEFSKQADIVLNRASVITGGQRGYTPPCRQDIHWILVCSSESVLQECFFCKKKGHISIEQIKLEKRNSRRRQQNYYHNNTPPTKRVAIALRFVTSHLI